MNEPGHHRRYRVAWGLYRDRSLSQGHLKALEREMDNAQNRFAFDEFQDFKETLPGFNEHWDQLAAEGSDMFQKRFGRPHP